MKKMIVVLLSAFALLSGGDACFAQVSAARHGGVHPGRDRRPEGYSKDSWTVYYRGLKVEGASASSFVDLGDGYGKDNWKVFYCGEEVKGASASSFESLGKGRGRDNWNTYLYGERQRANAKMTRTLGGGYSKDSWTVYYRRWKGLRPVRSSVSAGDTERMRGRCFFRAAKSAAHRLRRSKISAKGMERMHGASITGAKRSTVRLRPRSKSLRSDGDGPTQRPGKGRKRFSPAATICGRGKSL